MFGIWSANASVGNIFGALEVCFVPFYLVDLFCFLIYKMTILNFKVEKQTQDKG